LAHADPPVRRGNPDKSLSGWNGSTSVRSCFLAHAIDIDAGAIVRNFQMKIAAFMEGMDGNGALFGLISREP
jgi:hypothetical protein